MTMQILKVSEEQIEHAIKCRDIFMKSVRGNHIAGTSPDQRLTGFIGETVVADLMGMTRPSGNIGHDWMKDFIVNGVRIDLKTMGREVNPKMHYANNLMEGQVNYNPDVYLFASFNKKTKELTICGWQTKTDTLRLALKCEAGTGRLRDDGTTLPLTSANREIRNDQIVKWQDPYLFASEMTMLKIRI